MDDGPNDRLEEILLIGAVVLAVLIALAVILLVATALAPCELEAGRAQLAEDLRAARAELAGHAVLTMRRGGAGTLRIASDPNAEGFYVKMGARRIGEVPSRPDGRRLPLLVLEAREPRTR